MTPDWIAVDWGTSNLRAFAMQGDAVLHEASAPDGMASLSPAQFEPTLLRLIGPWLGDRVMPVLACGMVGARQGWAEAPYRAVPCPPVVPGETLRVVTKDPRIAVEIVPGLSQSAPPDVMRGEETQIAGFLSENPGFAGVLILPGTHSKHVRVADGRVTGFRTWMTGELFALLSQHSVLRHSMQGTGEDPAAFALGLATGNPLAGLFALRAESLLDDLPPAAAQARLSGMLIGAEIAALAPGTACAVIGTGALAGRYLQALAARGLHATAHDGADLVCRGLAAARKGGRT